MAGTGTTRANFGDLLEPGFRQIFFDQFGQLPTVYDKIFHVLDSSRQQEYDSSVTGFGVLVETTEGAPVTYEDPLTNIVAYIREGIRKSLKLRGTLNETIRNQATAIKKAVEGSTTIMGTSLKGWWDSLNSMAT